MSDVLAHRGIIETQLVRAAMAGEDIDRETLRERAGIGPGDFDVVMGVMLDDGTVRDTGGLLTFVEEPTPTPDPLDDPENVARDRNAAAIAGEEPPAFAARRFLIEQGQDVSTMNDVEVMAEVGRIVEERHVARTAVAEPAGWVREAVGEERAIRLTAQTAAALDGMTLGAMVFAGMQEAQAAGARFVLVVDP